MARDPRGFYGEPEEKGAANHVPPEAPQARSAAPRDHMPLYSRSSANVGASLGRLGAADKTKLLVDPRVQDLAADTGSRRSLNTVIRDLGPHINTNSLRFQRQQSFVTNLHTDGGPAFSPTVCLGNWVENRQEESYGSGYHARELGLTKIYETEAMARFRPPTKKYYEKVLAENPIAKFPGMTGPPEGAKSNKSDGRYLYYSNKGFGESACMDHTKASSRGGYWVGTAPVKKHVTVTASSATAENLEFQKRNSVYDPKANLLSASVGLDLTDAETRRTMESLLNSQRHTVTWKTTYSTDFLDRSRRALALTARPSTVHIM